MSTPAPRPTEVSPDLALSSALRWIDRPRDSSAWLWFGGREGVGRTRVLREIAERHPDSFFLDCAGLHSEEIARRVADFFGVAAPDTYGHNFSKAVTEISTGPVVILANTQWSGTLRTTREPERVLHQVARTLIRNHPRSVRMRILIEVDDSAGTAASLRGRELTLVGPDEQDEGTIDSLSPAETTAFRALALAESRSVPVAVWSLLCSALGHDVPARQLEQLISEHAPDTLTRASSEAGGPGAAFRRESTARAWRETVPSEEIGRFHRQVLASLRSAAGTSTTDWYIHHAAAGHAAAAGDFEALLEDAPIMARVGHQSLFEAFEAAYHDRAVPPAGLAANLHYMAERGVWPAAQGEWLALLHHALLNRGTSGTELAEGLVAAADPSEWPWLTLWARGEGPGMATTERVVRRPTVRRLRLVQTRSGPVAVATDGEGSSSAWELDSGNPVTEPEDAPAAPGSIAADQGLHGWRPAGAADGHVDLPRMPRYVRRAVRTGDRAVMSSSDGVFAIAIHSSASDGAQTDVLKRLLRTETRVATADLPPDATHPSAEWFEQVWGTTVLKRLAEDSLPSDLVDEDARRFLTEVGFPCLTGFLELDTLDLSATGLTPPGPPADKDRCFRLGTWQGAQLLLDGTNGKVLQNGSSGIDDPLAGTSLRQFVTMVRLYYWWYASDWPVEDAEADLRAWLARIDADAYAAQSWQRVFEDYNFTDRT
ncbi:SUKH-4 family immunity protein [Streptomyces sp. CdTB01]|uniref:SUKH-4 family immunity protein n=1 Tax=Streptomyces sp. CdTB01 TaxID=1725411 RepID=UPI00099E53C6|nr:SUKH-4 family immunity protein [Streptomyces sp. CdTB01]